MRFDDRVVFVTGGASGLGAAVATRITAEGGCAAIVDLDAAKAEAKAAELPRAIGFGLDVSDEESVEAAVNRAYKHFGRIDCVFNAAGHAEFGPVDTWSMARFQRMMTVHVGGTFLVCKFALPALRQSPAASIVNVASVAAITAQHNNAPYGAAKAGIASFSRQLARELAPAIRVNCIAPGRTLTGMTAPLMIERAGDLEKGSAVFGAANLQKRVAAAEEVAAPICFLLSDEASFITGAMLVADGGESISS